MESQHSEPLVPGSTEWLVRAGDRLTAYLMQDLQDLPAASSQEGSIFPYIDNCAQEDE